MAEGGIGASGPDPRRVETLADLVRELDLLRRRGARGTGKAKVSLTMLARQVDVPRSTVHAYLTGLTLAPSEVLDRIVIALGADAAEQARWADSWFRMAAQVDRARRADGAGLTAGATAVPRQLPPRVPVFTGRSEQLAQLDRALAEARSAAGGTAVLVSAIEGTAGVGKTALAVHWAHGAAEAFPDGQLYLNLRGYDLAPPMPAFDALAVLLRALGVGEADLPSTAAERSAGLRTLTAGRRLLFVLDNAISAEQVRDLLPGTPACFAVITSRDALAGLAAHDGVGRIDLDRLPTAEAVALLSALIGTRVDDEPAATGTLVQWCGRLPLALRITAEVARARPTRPLASLLTEFDDESRRLELLDSTGDPRTDVRTVFSWSYRRLPVDAARLFRLLGRLPGADFDAYTAAALAGVRPSDAVALVDVLARAHLVEDRGAGRHGLHDLLRAYAAGLPDDEDGERGPALGRLLDYYRAAADAAVRQAYPAQHVRLPDVPGANAAVPPMPDDAAGRAWLTDELDAMLAAVHTAAVRGFPQHTVDLAMTLWRHLETVGRWDDAVALYETALRASRAAGDRAGEAGALRNLGMLLESFGRHQDALEHFQRALAIRRRLGEPRATAAVLISIGVALDSLGRFAEAIDSYDRAHDLSGAFDDPLGTANALLNLGLVHERRGDYGQARDNHRRALATFRTGGDRLGEAHTLTNLGNVERLLGDPPAAGEHLRAALAIYGDLAHRSGEAWARTGLGEVHHVLGESGAAIEHHEAALVIAREVGDPGLQAEILNNLGEALLGAGRTGDATAAHQLAGAVARDHDDRYEQARAGHGLGRTLRAGGRPGPAAAEWRRALALFDALGVPDAAAVRRDLDALTRRFR